MRVRGETTVKLFVLLPNGQSRVRQRKLTLAVNVDSGDREEAVQWVREFRDLNPALAHSGDVIITRTTMEAL